MIDRIYIDNFRTLVNVTIPLKRNALLLGENGTGKTSVLDALRSIQRFVSGEFPVKAAFPTSELTRWQKSPAQRFEIDLRTGEGVYHYELLLHHDMVAKLGQVRKELLTLDGKTLFEYSEGTAHLYNDTFRAGPSFPFDWFKAPLGTVYSRPDNTKLTNFKNQLAKILIVKPCPPMMAAESPREDAELSDRAENFVSWYRYIQRQAIAKQHRLFDEISKYIPGFKSLDIPGSAEGPVLMHANFALPGSAEGMPASGDEHKTIPYGFDKLSDGQRMLILLFTLLYALPDAGWSLFIDEPDNYVALREIQPWLLSLCDAVGDGIEQSVLCSHHPEIIDYLAENHGVWFFRDAGGPTRASDKLSPPIAHITPAEAVARGWVK